jgi:hypothetical protein
VRWARRDIEAADVAAWRHDAREWRPLCLCAPCADRKKDEGPDEQASHKIEDTPRYGTEQRWRSIPASAPVRRVAETTVAVA